MPHDEPGGSSGQQDRDGYVHLRTSVFFWRLRLGTSTLSVVYVMAGESVALLFLVLMALSVGVLWAGRWLAQLEYRVNRLRQGRRW